MEILLKGYRIYPATLESLQLVSKFGIALAPDDVDELLFGEAEVAVLGLHEEVHQGLCLDDAFVLEVGKSLFAVITSLVALLGIEIGFAEVVELELAPAGAFVFAVFNHFS